MDLEELSRKLAELAKQKKDIENEMNRIIFTSPGGGVTPGGGCLRLEDVYSTRAGRKYGPYGPYYYIYYHHTSKMEKRYVGKRADHLTSRTEAGTKLDQLEKEYKRILRLERKLTKLIPATASQN